MTERRGFHDRQRCILRVDGEEAHEWLQSLITNDISRLSADNAVYAALLSPQGKYLFDFICHDDGQGGVLLDVAANRAEDLLKRLGLYRIRRKVRVTHEDALGVALIWGGEAAPDGAVPDPRSAAMGWRLLAEDPVAALAERHVTPAARQEHEALRVAAGVPETGIELVPDDTHILEAGFERLNGVDFRKG